MNLTPSEATPHKFDMTVIGGRTVTAREWFTAAECVQIARRLKVVTENLWMSADDSQEESEAAKELGEWESLFTQWEGK